VSNKSKQSPTAVGTTSSGPSHPASPQTEMAGHAAEQEALAGAMPFNESKPREFGYDNAISPEAGPASLRCARASRR
jgi:hypothetical protein